MKKILRKSFMKSKIQVIRKNDYHSGIMKQLITILSSMNTSTPIIGSYIHKPNTQIIPPFINTLLYAYPSFNDHGRQMTFHKFSQGGNLMYSSDKKVYGIKVLHEKYKDNTKVENSDLNVVLVPLTAFDPMSLNRIGYGGGYYDNFIKQCRQSKKVSPKFVGIGLECLKIRQVDVKVGQIFNEFDQPLDCIITEQQIY